MGPYIESYDAEMRGEGYARHTRELQTRLVADFGCWLAKRGIQAQNITVELLRPYLLARARRRRPTRNDLPALQRLLDLLRRQGAVSAAALPVTTPAQRLQSEFCLYLRQERALASTTQAAYTAFVSEFLTERFGAGPVDLSRLCAADVTIRAAACQHHPEQAGPVDDDRAEIVSTICALSGRHRKGSGRLHTGGGQLETVDPASRPSSRPSRAGIELGEPENGHGPARLRDSLDPGTSGLARR